ncbi:MAG: glycosyltransferase [Candidatus Aminicenantes bacterium]|nr:glycosyltransferase [Candidatus Aminicenantes bacterium]NIM79437.1 glycosyltransferase [Candidatus Aminicenantes bacterium]NIN18719.1 glycosyltransferase [Candidatus Aminicenantes bacterium]NIN42643.1 glycosyltransferase [Candidatus Aminicenantes bacterium]NIN85382.1 glycosyltransferase [Candidatus Aminicenantes bacterium]
MLKVVHIITKLELGGAQINTIYTYEHLDETQFEAYLLSGPGGILTDKVEKKERFSIVKNLVRPINPGKDLKTFFQLRKQLKKIKPDVVHTHSSKAGIIGRLAAFTARVPVVIHSVHGFSFSPFQSFLKRTFFITAEKLISRLTDHFIFVSSDDIQVGRKRKLIKKKENFSLIRSGFPLKKFTGKTADTDTTRQRFNIKESDFVCGIIAPFKPQKGLFHLLEIASKVLAANEREKNIVFLLAGDGDLRPVIETKLKEKGIVENFRLPGFVFDIEHVIDIFDLGISTALWEGLPQSLVQLRLKKKPVVASDIPGNREVIKNDKNGFLVDVFDYQMFAERILFLVNNRETRVRLADFEEDFSQWDADYMVRQQEDLYHSLVKGPPPRGCKIVGNRI